MKKKSLAKKREELYQDYKKIMFDNSISQANKIKATIMFSLVLGIEQLIKKYGEKE